MLPGYAGALNHVHDPCAFAEEAVHAGYGTGRNYLNVQKKSMRMIEGAGGP